MGGGGGADSPEAEQDGRRSAGAAVSLRVGMVEELLSAGGREGVGFHLSARLEQAVARFALGSGLSDMASGRPAAYLCVVSCEDVSRLGAFAGGDGASGRDAVADALCAYAGDSRMRGASILGVGGVRRDAKKR